MKLNLNKKYLGAIDYEGKKQKEVATLEQTIAYKKQVIFCVNFVSFSFFNWIILKEYEKSYENKTKKMKEIKNQAVKFANSNDQFDDDLREKNVVLHDHKHINDELSMKFSYYFFLPLK